MSTILDALKRLEDKTRSREDKSIPEAMRGRRRGRGSGRRVHVKAAAVVLLAIGAVSGGYWGYSQWAGRMPDKGAASSDLAPGGSGTSPSERVAPETSGAKQAPAAASRALPAGGKASPSTAGAQAYRGAGKSVRKPNKPPATNQPQPSSPNASPPSRRSNSDLRSAKSAESPNRTIDGAVEERRSALRSSVSPRPPQPGKPTPKTPPSPSLPVRDPYANAELMLKGDLDLQAISWSDLSSDRLTIINNSILREGQAVEGYTVTEIRPDHVIISKAQNYWKLGYED